MYDRNSGQSECLDGQLHVYFVPVSLHCGNHTVNLNEIRQVLCFDLAPLVKSNYNHQAIYLKQHANAQPYKMLCHKNVIL